VILRDTVVGVIDSGWDRRVVDDRIEQGFGFTSTFSAEQSIEWTANSQDLIGHGTACADVILQVAPESRIIPIRIFEHGLSTSPQALIRAIDLALECSADVIHLSLTTSRVSALPAIYAACERAVKAGAIVVAAGRHQDDCFPATLDPVIGVAESTDVEGFDLRYHSDAAIECEACGVQNARGLLGVRRTFTGASFAAPVVSGHVANYLRRKPRSDLSGVRRMLKALSQQESKFA
jgi:subtilisin